MEEAEGVESPSVVSNRTSFFGSKHCLFGFREASAARVVGLQNVLTTRKPEKIEFRPQKKLVVKEIEFSMRKSSELNGRARYSP